MKRARTRFFMFVFSAFAAAQSALAAGTTSNLPIKMIQYYEGHTGLLLTQEQMADPDACGRRDYYIVRQEHPRYKEITALLLMAHGSNMPITMTLSGCYQGLPSIQHVWSLR